MVSAHSGAADQPQPGPGTKVSANSSTDGAHAHQRLNLGTEGKARGRNTKASNRTREIQSSGIIGGLGKRSPGGVV